MGDTKYLHAFDGLALLHSFSIKNGEYPIKYPPLKCDGNVVNIIAALQDIMLILG